MCIRDRDLTVKLIREGKDEATKAAFTFQMSKHHWKSIEEEMRAWVETNWERWQEEEPNWLDEAMRARIPLEYIPTATARQQEKERRGLVVNISANKKRVKPVGQEQDIPDQFPSDETSLEYPTIADTNLRQKEIAKLMAAVRKRRYNKKEIKEATTRFIAKLEERGAMEGLFHHSQDLSLIHISEPTRPY